MGRIADATPIDEGDDDQPFTNKVDDILDGLEDDADRAVVLSWLYSDIGDEAVESRLFEHGISCSDSTIRRWRRYQTAGMGRMWAA